MKSFEEQLKNSNEAEISVARSLQKQGWGVIPSYDYSGENGEKAPRLMLESSGFPIPDLDISRDGHRYWVEVKRYTYAPFNHRLKSYVHGFAKRLYDAYIEVERITGCDVWIAIEEEKNHRLLVARLKDLTVYPCQCSECEHGVSRKCKAPIKRGVYFRVDQFHERTTTLCT